MDEVADCARIVEVQIEQHGFPPCRVTAKRTPAGQIVAQVTTPSGRTAGAPQRMMIEAIWAAENQGHSLDKEFSDRNFFDSEG